MTPWLSVVGCGPNGWADVPPAACPLILEAEVVFAADRLRPTLPQVAGEVRSWPTPFSDALAAVEALRGRRVCVLASGDPMWFGVGASLARRVPPAEMTVIPAPSAFALAAARLAWPLQEVATLSLHGRPLAGINGHLSPGARLLILSRDGDQPAEVATHLAQRGFGPSRLWVLEDLDGPAERIVEGTAAAWPGGPCADLNVLAVEARAAPGTAVPAPTPGLPDAFFRHDGRLTKREVRAATLAALEPRPGSHLWDVGAGCGAVAVEWARAAPGARATAVEPRADRRAFIADNAAALGVPDVAAVAGEAPGALAGLDRPDAVFVGGGAATPGVLEAAWAALPPGGRLVANTVTLEGERAVHAMADAHGGERVRLSVAHATAVGGFTAWAGKRPVVQWRGIKG